MYSDVILNAGPATLDVGSPSQVPAQSDIASVTHRTVQIETLPRVEAISSVGIEWIVQEIVASGALHLLTGDVGAGKSTLVSALAYAASVGQDFLGFATSKRPVLQTGGIGSEDPADAAGRGNGTAEVRRRPRSA